MFDVRKAAQQTSSVGDRQLSLLGGGPPGLPSSLDGLTRLDLGRGSWIDHQECWLPGPDAWLDELRDSLDWKAMRRPMYERVVDVPRLVANRARAELESEKLETMAAMLSDHYGRYITSVGFNWYRNGNDSVAWHADRVPDRSNFLVAIVGVGERRAFQIRPAAGSQERASKNQQGRRRWMMGDGDLLVMGGTTQAHWHHGIPKVACAGERISMMFRG